MTLKFTAVKNKRQKGMFTVKYFRDKDDGNGLVETATYSTTNPFVLIGGLVSNIPFNPALINSVEVIAKGVGIDFLDN